MAFVQTRMALVKLLQIKTNKIITDKLRPRDYKRKIFQALITTPTESEVRLLPRHIFPFDVNFSAFLPIDNHCGELPVADELGFLVGLPHPAGDEL